MTVTRPHVLWSKTAVWYDIVCDMQSKALLLLSEIGCKLYIMVIHEVLLGVWW